LFGCTAGSLRRRVAFGLGRSRAAGPVGRTEASRLLLAGGPALAGPAGGGALRVRRCCRCLRVRGEDRHCCRCWPGEEEEDDRCRCRQTQGWGGAADGRCRCCCCGRPADGRRRRTPLSRSAPRPLSLGRPGGSGLAGVARLLAAGCQGFVYTYSQCADPGAEACSARGAPDREALLRAGVGWRGAPRCGPGPRSAGRR
jgi:hypothetical protein